MLALLGPQEIDVLIERGGAEARLIEKIETLADLGTPWNSFRGQVDVHLHGLVGGNQNGGAAGRKMVGNALALQLAGDGPRFLGRQTGVEDAIFRLREPVNNGGERDGNTEHAQVDDLSSSAERLPAVPPFFESSPIHGANLRKLLALCVELLVPTLCVGTALRRS